MTGEVDSDGTGTLDLETFVEVVRVKQKEAEDEVEIKVVYTKKVGKWFLSFFNHVYVIAFFIHLSREIAILLPNNNLTPPE